MREDGQLKIRRVGCQCRRGSLSMADAPEASGGAGRCLGVQEAEGRLRMKRHLPALPNLISHS